MLPTCPLCVVDAAEVVWDGEHVRAVRDRFPVTDGHVLIAPKRHVGRLSELSGSERAELFGCVEAVWDRVRRSATDRNLGINDGEHAGQTLQHVNLHVIPRRPGDHPIPAGGIRAVIPARKDWRRIGTYARNLTEPFLDGGPGRQLIRPLLAELEEAVEVDIAVAFISHGGLDLIDSALRAVLMRSNARIRIFTGDYLDFNEPEVLRRLAALPSPAESFVVDSRGSVGLHAKTFLIKGRHGESCLFVGSSNLTESALVHSIEWNARIDEHVDPEMLRIARQSFEGLRSNVRTKRLDEAWISSYERRRAPRAYSDVPERSGPRLTGDSVRPPTPTDIQAEALRALSDDMTAQSRAGLVVLATGLGKTFLAAFTLKNLGFRRCLFVAHREEILNQAEMTFRRCDHRLHVTRIQGGLCDPSGEVVVASVQSLAQARVLDGLASDAFDLIVVDEFHHATAAQYRRVINHFEPRYLLGLTATPRRTDHADVLALCGGNLVYECDLFRGIAESRLAPFDYLGIADPIDYQQGAWFSRRMTAEEIGTRLALDQRAEHAVSAWRTHIGPERRTLVFCASLNHARFMREYFQRAASEVPAAIVHSAADSDSRGEALSRLRDGSIRLLFSVDLLNEGVDVPEVDGVLMLRPTESTILFLQQLGRGLRWREGKRLKVVDFVGNHQVFLRKLLVVCNESQSDPSRLLTTIRSSHGVLASDCGSTVAYELAAIELLERARHLSRGARLLRDWYAREFAEHGIRPSFRDAVSMGFYNRDGVPRTNEIESWASVLHSLDDAAREVTAPDAESRAFLDALQTVKASTPLKLLVLELFVQDQSKRNHSALECARYLKRRITQDPRLGRLIGWNAVSGSEDARVDRLKRELWEVDGALVLEEDETLRLAAGGDRGMTDECSALAMEIIEGRLAMHVEEEQRRRAQQLRNAARTMVNDQGRAVDARWAWEWEGNFGRLTLFARGTNRGAGDAAVDVNPHYAEALRLLLARLGKLGGRLVACFLDSKGSQELPITKRLLRPGTYAYPIDLSLMRGDGEVARAIQSAQQVIGQSPNAKGGNNTRRIALIVDLPAATRASVIPELEGSRTSM
jgi:superfamily II DNA or RNA helicase/diadenosine tetraphosphate (Ap4A) HIT family hydrolase